MAKQKACQVGRISDATAMLVDRDGRLAPEFYEVRLWKEELENVLLPMLEKYEGVLVEEPAHVVERCASLTP